MHQIPDTFLSYASEILANTNEGFTTSKILSIFSSYSVDFNTEIPHSKLPISAQNKRIAFLENLRCFNAEQQYKILADSCLDPLQCNRNEVKKLYFQLRQYYGTLNKESVAYDRAMAEDTSHWLSKYPIPLKFYKEALEKRSHGIYERNLLDDLRLSLELLLKTILKNDKSLENQISLIGPFVSKAGGTKEFCNMFLKLVDYFCKYQNEHVKHNDKVAEMEIDFIVDITSTFMKCICRLAE